MKIPDVVRSILRSAAPTLLTALVLPPPLNAIASAVVSGALGKYLPGDEADQGRVPRMTPEQVTKVIEKNADNPDFILALRQAEADLEKYETEARIRFVELEVKDRQRAGEFQIASGLGLPVFLSGMSLVALSVAGMLGIVFGAIYLVRYGVQIPEGRGDIAVAAFGLIGTAVGFINGIAANVVTYYWGSSHGSKEKADQLASIEARSSGERDELYDGLRHMMQKFGEAVVKESSPPAAVRPAATLPLAASKLRPAVPARLSLLDELIPSLVAPHRCFQDGVEWALTRRGISVDRADPQGTPGVARTAASIWETHGLLCCSSAARYGVPVELIVATIATESGGDPDALRAEPRLEDESVGLMQTLVRTAREATGRSDLKAADLLDPATSIDAGTAYITQQRCITHFDPPLVAAAYNAGSIRHDDGEANRWRVLCYSKGTGQHVDRFVAWFNDCMRLSAEQNWAQGKQVPSFAACLK